MRVYWILPVLFFSCASTPPVKESHMERAAVECAENINEWQQPEWCECLNPEDTYNPVAGSCVEAMHPLGKCSTKKNKWNKPTNCNCPRELTYNQIMGLCVADPAEPAIEDEE